MNASGTRRQIEQGRELGLTTRTTIIDDHFTGDRFGDGSPQIILDQRQCQVDPSSDPRRTPHRTVSDEYSIGVDADGRVSRLEPGGEAPMCRGTTSIQQASRSQHESTCADTRDALCPRSDRRQKGDRGQ
jgi:hypothetical protein